MIIIICTTTSSTPVILHNPELYKGKHIITIGTYQPENKELSNGVMEATDYIYSDRYNAS